MFSPSSLSVREQGRQERERRKRVPLVSVGAAVSPYPEPHDFCSSEPSPLPVVDNQPLEQFGK